ncbi:MAG: homocysteine S-methyltransferase family protein, partial [Firmicutes bacterium]|nr:homocysteine S-methyltransferase family protein [Bacillota bacterium]
MSLRKSLSENKILILDGAMGTELARRGLEAGGNLNLTAADHILDFHREYVELGVDCITTNTFTMNRIYIESHKIKIDLRKVNEAGVKLAREAAG